MSRVELFNRCLNEEIQNNNESLNSLIWYFAPNYLLSRAKIVQIATYIAVIMLNKGFLRILKLITIVGCPNGRKTHTHVQNHDEVLHARNTTPPQNESFRKFHSIKIKVSQT